MTTRTTRTNLHENEDDDEIPTFTFNGKTYTSYQEMVNAKRKRNQDVLEASGLLKAPQPLTYTSHATGNQQRNKNRQAQLKAAPRQPSRRSSRLSQSEKPNYKEASIEQLATVVRKRPRTATTTTTTTTTSHSRLVSPSPAAPAPNSVRSINIDTNLLVLGEKGVLGQMMDRTGKEFVINESFSLAASPEDQKRLAGSRLSFNKYCGVQEFKNAIFLWINLGSKDNPVVNDFLNDAKQVTWFGGSRMHDESPVIHKLLKMGQNEGKVGNNAHSDIILWCRRYQTDTKQFSPYVCFGRLSYDSHVPQSHPLKFIWNLVDYDGLKNHSDEAVRERFAAFTT